MAAELGAHGKKRYAVLVIREHGGERHRQTFPALNKREVLHWARELNPYDVVDVTIMRWGEVVGVWRKGHEAHGVEAFAIRCVGDADDFPLTRATKASSSMEAP